MPTTVIPFLRDLYQRINNDPKLEMTTISDALSRSTPVSLKRLASGSWIRSDFTTWIGHPEENLAWELLPSGADRIDRIPKSILPLRIPRPRSLTWSVSCCALKGATGSGGTVMKHVTAQADIFDRLFRLHLEGLYHTKGLPVPARLTQSIKPVKKQTAGFEPTACFTPAYRR